ncbi:MAG: hypothetical protein FJZ57_02770 [Chlamydiae bacterium]|nr:hypothetical protein [Chlamydiota bacterium]
MKTISPSKWNEIPIIWNDFHTACQTLVPTKQESTQADTNSKITSIAVAALKRVAYFFMQIPNTLVDIGVYVFRGSIYSFTNIPVLLSKDSKLNKELLIKQLLDDSCQIKKFKTPSFGPIKSIEIKKTDLLQGGVYFEKSISLLNTIPVRFIKAFDANAFEPIVDTNSQTSDSIDKENSQTSDSNEELTNYTKTTEYQNAGILTQKLKLFLKSQELQTKNTSLKILAKAGHVAGLATRPIDFAIGYAALTLSILHYIPAAVYDCINWMTKNSTDYKDLRLHTYTNEYCNSIFLRGGNLLEVTKDCAFALKLCCAAVINIFYFPTVAIYDTSNWLRYDQIDYEDIKVNSYFYTIELDKRPEEKFIENLHRNSSFQYTDFDLD